MYPSSAPISNSENKTYTLTADMNNSIVIQRDNINVDGAGFTTFGPGVFFDSSIGLWIDNVSNVFVKRFDVESFRLGTLITSALNVTFSQNNMTNNGDGIYLQSVNNSKFTQNVIRRNLITPLYYGIVAYNSSGNTYSHNSISGNGNEGLRTTYTSDNTIIGNNITGANEFGIRVESAFNDTIKNNNIARSRVGIWTYPSEGNTITNNTITSNDLAGIRLEYAGTKNNRIESNTFINNTCAILIRESADNNTINSNHFLNNSAAISVTSAFNNTIYHNNFISNTPQASATSSENRWDNGFEGNYWSNYTETDNNQDGIGDVPLTIGPNNTDRFPLMGLFQEFTLTTDTGISYDAQVISNSTLLNVTAFYWNATPNQYFKNEQAYILLNLVVRPNSTGFIRATFPKLLLNATTYTVLVNMTETSTKTIDNPDPDLATVYFGFNNTAREAIIVPEYPPFALAFASLIISSFFIVYLVKERHEDPDLLIKA